MGVLDALLAHGDVNATDGWGSSLHMAARMGQAGAIEALIEAGANIEMEGSGGLTPLGCAARDRHCQAMRALLQRGANTCVQDNQGDTPLHLACRAQGDHWMQPRTSCCEQERTRQP